MNTLLSKENPTLEQLLINEGVVIMTETQIPGFSHIAPFGVFLQNLIKRERLVELIAMKISTTVPREITDLVGFGYDGITIGAKVAKYSHKEFTPIELELNKHKPGFRGFHQTRPFNDKKVGLVCGTVTTGMECLEYLEMLKAAGAKVEDIFTGFDYGIRFKTNALLKVKIHAAATTKSLTKKTHSDPLIEWVEEHKKMFR